MLPVLRLHTASVLAVCLALAATAQGARLHAAKTTTTTSSSKSISSTSSSSTTTSPTSSASPDTTSAPSPSDLVTTIIVVTASNATSVPWTTTTGLPFGNTTQSPTASPHTSSTPVASLAVIPLAIGVSIGGSFLLLSMGGGYFLWRRRKRRLGVARAETPPPRDAPDDDVFPPTIHEAPGTDVPRSAALLHTDGFHAGSIFNTLSQYNDSSNRFGPDAVAMHDVQRKPSVGWEPRGGSRGPSPAPEPIPPHAKRTTEIPYDPRRLPAYYGPAPVLYEGYSELPG